MIVTTRQEITGDNQFMRGHGTYQVDDTVYASVPGQVIRVNKLISVIPLKQRYQPEIGDVVVGRIVDVGAKRWRVDIQSRQHAVLLLSSVNLPGAAQRRRLESDQLQMYTILAEHDLVVAGVQQFFHDGAVSLHTRSLKYGKLKNGTLVQVPAYLVRRSKAHFITYQLDGGMFDVVLGINGSVFVSVHAPELTIESVELQPDLLYSNEPQKPCNPSERRIVAQLVNSIKQLADQKQIISEQSIRQQYASLAHQQK